jgi:PAS domain-containing protein
VTSLWNTVYEPAGQLHSCRRVVLGTFASYYSETNDPKREDLGIIEILTRTAALAIQHHQAEQDLADSEERFRSLSRCSLVGIFTFDVGGDFTYVNPKFRELRECSSTRRP